MSEHAVISEAWATSVVSMVLAIRRLGANIESE